MTEQNTSPATIETTVDETEKITSSSAPNKKSGSGLGAVAIALTIALAAGVFWHGHKQAGAFKSSINDLQEQLVTLKDNQQQQLNKVLQQQQDLHKAVQRELTHQQNLFAQLQSKMATMSGTSTKTWLLAQADFMVKTASRKLIFDQDVIAALALLREADTSLAAADNPDYLSARRTLTEDMRTLVEIHPVDSDGIILHLMQLVDQVDNLRLAHLDTDEKSTAASHDEELSSSISEWQHNLRKSWQSFVADFITIRRREGQAAPLLSPEQDIYLRENLRARLLIAIQAVPRHQNEIYHTSLATVASWVKAYFNMTDESTKSFLQQLDQLNQQTILLKLPDSLKSLEAIEKLMQLHIFSSSLPPLEG